MPYVQLTIAEGRSDDEKKALLASVARAVHETISAPLETIHVWLTEAEPAHISIAGESLVVRREKAARAAQQVGAPTAP
jgi:4-oxalocrotonate tautomerase